MAHRSSRGRSARPPAPAARSVSLRTLLVVAAGVVALLAVGWWVRSERADFPAREAAGTGPAATEPRAGIDASVVAGRWQRLEGGYVLDIASVAADGAMTVAYLNPRSINVSAARASQAGDAIEVFVELRDVNYPGATYRLTYDAATDRLAGTYHQPALGQSFDVVFVRARP